MHFYVTTDQGADALHNTVIFELPNLLVVILFRRRPATGAVLCQAGKQPFFFFFFSP
jgi:hypothetical protein